MTRQARPASRRVLWVATKAPWPPRDGGRLLMWQSLGDLAAQGVGVTLVAPVPSADAGRRARAELTSRCDPRLVVWRPPPLPLALLAARRHGLPWTIARHRSPAVAREVGRLVAASDWRLAHAEQLQALVNAAAARDAGLPTLLRAQNVESDLWHTAANGPLAPLARGQAATLATWEGRAVATTDATATLSQADAERLRELAGSAAPIEVVPPPFPAELAAGEPLPGDPALVLLAAGGWRPNRIGAERFLALSWPRLRQRLPAARLHLFADWRPAADLGIDVHPLPADSRTAFAAGAVLLVPLTVASGVRMKILEAWARGLPVIATPAAAAGLEAEDEVELLLAPDPGSFAPAVERLVDEPGLAHRLVESGRRRLRQRHDPQRLARRWVEIYEEVSAAG